MIDQHGTFIIAPADHAFDAAKGVCSRCGKPLDPKATRIVEAVWNKLTFRYCEKCGEKK